MSLQIAGRAFGVATGCIPAEEALRETAREHLSEPVLGGFLSVGQSNAPSPQEDLIVNISGSILTEAACLAVLGSNDPNPLTQVQRLSRIHREKSNALIASNFCKLLTFKCGFFESRCSV